MERPDHDPGTARPVRDGGAGFSLLELTVVLVIAGIMAAIAAPTLATMDRMRRAAAAVRLSHDLAYARQYAVATGTRTWVNIDAAADRYCLLVEDSASAGRTGAKAMTAPDGTPLIVDLAVPEYAGAGIASVSLDAGSEVGFDWLGAPLSSAGAGLAEEGVILLAGGASVRIAPVTGQITLINP